MNVGQQERKPFQALPCALESPVLPRLYVLRIGIIPAFRGHPFEVGAAFSGIDAECVLLALVVVQ